MHISIQEISKGKGYRRLEFYPSLWRHLLKKTAGYAVIMEIDGRWWSVLHIPSKYNSSSVLSWESERSAVEGVSRQFEWAWFGPSKLAQLR